MSESLRCALMQLYEKVVDTTDEDVLYACSRMPHYIEQLTSHDAEDRVWAVYSISRFGINFGPVELVVSILEEFRDSFGDGKDVRGRHQTYVVEAAASAGQHDTVLYLLRYRPDLVCYYSLQQSLFSAVFNLDVRMFRLLLVGGTCVLKSDRYGIKQISSMVITRGRCPLDLGDDRLAILRMALETGEEVTSPFAIAEGRYLLRLGPPVLHTVTDGQMTRFDVAQCPQSAVIRNNRPRALRMMFEFGADANIAMMSRSGSAVTALTFALHNKFWDVCKILLENGAVALPENVLVAEGEVAAIIIRRGTPLPPQWTPFGACVQSAVVSQVVGQLTEVGIGMVSLGLPVLVVLFVFKHAKRSDYERFDIPKHVKWDIVKLIKRRACVF